MQTASTYTDAASFWDKIAPKYAKKPVGDPTAYEEKLTRLRSLMRAEDRVLEIGCGTGSTALQLASSVAAYTATDISREMISIAEGKQKDAPVRNLTFQIAAADDKIGETPFDVVTAFSLLHLVDDLPAVLHAVFTQTKPGGLFISKTVCLGDGFFGLRWLVRALRVVGIAPPVAMLRKSDVHDALIAAGFDILECQYFGKSRLNPFFIAQRPN